MTLQPGIHPAIPAEDYHAEAFTDGPMLSASTAATLCTRSPLHAWTNHPRLNPNYERKVDDKFSVGVVAHAMLLEGRNAVHVVHEPSWRTNSAKEERDYARSLGKVPLLFDQCAEVEAMVDAVKAQLAEHRAAPPMFTAGKPEVTLTWDENGVQCKARLDWLRDDLACIDDLKSTSRSADPASFSRNLYGTGADVQAAFYLRGVDRLKGVRPKFRWAVCETSPPYAVSVVRPSSEMLTLADDKIEWAMAQWGECLKSGRWPGYSDEEEIAEVPSYEVERWMRRELEEAA